MAASVDPPLSEVAESLAPPEPLPLIGHAYDWPTEVVVAWNKLVGPSRRHSRRTSFLPSRHSFCSIEPQLRIAFVGDVLPARGREYRVGDSVRRMLEDVDYLVLNLEGPIGAACGVVNSVRHEPGILDFLADLFPPQRTVTLCANNHAVDCGKKGLTRTCRELQDRGFLIAGGSGDPSILLPEGVQLSNGTEWLNVRRNYAPRLAEADAAWSGAARLRIFCPHWGTEMTLFPSPRQIARARRLAERWDVIVGHHPHCPQPIAAENGRLVAYSLGNFARGDSGPRGWHGAAVRATIGPDGAGQWGVGEVDWTFIVQTPRGSGGLLIETAARCRFFPSVIGEAF